MTETSVTDTTEKLDRRAHLDPEAWEKATLTMRSSFESVTGLEMSFLDGSKITADVLNAYGAVPPSQVSEMKEALESIATYDFMRLSKYPHDAPLDVEWIRQVPVAVGTEALRSADKAHRAFMAGRSGRPQFKSRKSPMGIAWNPQGCRVRHLNAKWAMVRVPKLGLVKFRCTRPLPGRFTEVVVRQVAGAWYVSFRCRVPNALRHKQSGSVGIDRGVANSIADSTGGVAHLPISPETSLARAQRVLSRRKRGSNRYAKQRLRVARLKAKQARIRKDWIHRTTTDIARHYGHVVLEDLNTKGMTAKGRGKRGLNRSILEQGWAMFATMLAYKLEERGGTLEFVNPAYTSQTCAECGMVDSRSRKSQATFECVHCGHADHADINAAKNILRRSTAFMRVEGRQWPPGETRTIPNLAAVAVGGC